MNKDQAGRYRERAQRRAEALFRDPSMADHVASMAARRGEALRARLGDALEDVKTLSRLVRAWATGRYPDAPRASIIAALLALVYFLMPLDAVPDFIAALGLIDDVAVISRVVHHIRSDLQRFRAWEAEQPTSGVGEDHGDAGA